MGVKHLLTIHTWQTLSLPSKNINLIKTRPIPKVNGQSLTLVNRHVVAIHGHVVTLMQSNSRVFPGRHVVETYNYAMGAGFPTA